MRWVFRWLLRGLLALIALAVVGFIAGYVAVGDNYGVAATVVDDPALPRVTVNGVQLHLRTFGSETAPPLIVLHGGPGGDHRSLLPLKALADRYRVVFYDQRGSGLSQRLPDEQLTLDAVYDELDAVVDRFRRGGQVQLIGHSWGAMLATGYLGRHPEKVAGAVLAEPGFLTPGTGALLMDKTNNMRPRPSWAVLWTLGRIWLQSLHVGGPDEDAPSDFFAGRLMVADVEGHPLAGYYCEGDLSRGRLESWRLGARARARLMAEGSDDQGRVQVNFTRGLERFKRPVLLLAGACNRLIGAAHQRLHLKHFARAELKVIRGAGHTMFGEQPEQSLAVIRPYLARMSGAVAARPGQPEAAAVEGRRRPKDRAAAKPRRRRPRRKTALRQ
jgi:proline iminopeptidase